MKVLFLLSRICKGFGLKIGSHRPLILKAVPIDSGVTVTCPLRGWLVCPMDTDGGFSSLPFSLPSFLPALSPYTDINLPKLVPFLLILSSPDKVVKPGLGVDEWLLEELQRKK